MTPVVSPIVVNRLLVYSERHPLVMVDLQEGMEEVIGLCKEWQEVQRNLGQMQEDEDRELNWAVGNSEM